MSSSSPTPPTPAAAAAAVKYDLTARIIPHLDPHHALSLLEFLRERQMYNQDDVRKVILKTLGATKMIDYAEEEYKALHNATEIPAEMARARDEVYAQLTEWKEPCTPLMDVLVNVQLVEQLRADKQFTLEYLREHHQVTDDTVEATFRYAKLNFDIGRYRDASDLLYYFRLLSTDETKCFQALWGKLAAEMLLGEWTTALDDLHALHEAIDARTHVSHTEQLQQRTWLLHWCVFIFFNHPDGRSLMPEFIMDDSRLVNTLQTTSIYLLRYMTLAVVCDKRRKSYFNDFVRILREESLSDPVVQFILKVYVDFDFESARDLLREADIALSNDFFSAHMKDEFLHQARLLMFETIARTHKYIRIDTLVSYLDLPTDDDKSERAVVDFIRESRTDAKVDSEGNQLVMSQSFPGIYQQVIDKTKLLSHRSTQMVGQMEKKMLNLMESNAD